MTPTREQVGAIVWSVLLIISVLGVGGVGSVAATDHSQNSTQVDVDPKDLAGSGTTDDPYQLTNASELQAMEDDLDAHYELTTNIDASNTSQWNNGSGFDPIGGDSVNSSSPDPFTGSLDGNNHTISGITINRSNEGQTGLFGVTSGNLTDMSLTNLSVHGSFSTGGLIGAIEDTGTVTNVATSGNVTGTQGVGGIAGTNFKVEGTVISDARSSVSVNGSDSVGGLIGSLSSGSIANATAAGDVSGDGRVGGLVGSYSGGKITDTRASGDVSGFRSVGGLVGRSVHTENPNVTITSSRASGEVTGVKDVGGLVGDNTDETIVSVRASGNVTGSGTAVGGLVGTNNQGRVANATASGDVVGKKNTGGLVGENINGTITDVRASGDVNAADSGLISSHGGLVGDHSGTIADAQASGDVTGGNLVGGLVGVDSNAGTITNARASGNVTGSDSVGGLVGFAAGTVQGVFAVGNVTGNNSVGGVVGEIGQADPTITDAYWDEQATGQSTSAGSATGLTTPQMTGQAARTNMSGLDFEDNWTTTESYPELRDQGNGRSAALIVAPPDALYSPTEPFTIGTTHNATGTIDDGDVAIRLVNVTGDNETVVALNDTVPIAGQVNTTIPAGRLSGDVTIETQLYDLSAQRVVATDTLNLSADAADGEDGIISQYDVDGDGLETSELLTGIGDWRDGDIETQELLTLIDAWRSNNSS